MPINTNPMSQVEYHRIEAQTIYQEVQLLEAELKITTVQHKRQSLKHQIEVKRMQWQVQNLHRENEELKASAVAKVMASKVRAAERAKENVQESIKDKAKITQRRLLEMAEKLGQYIEHDNYEYMMYTMLNDMPVMLGNSSLDTLSRNRAELAQAEQIILMAGGTTTNEDVKV